MEKQTKILALTEQLEEKKKQLSDIILNNFVLNKQISELTFTIKKLQKSIDELKEDNTNG